MEIKNKMLYIDIKGITPFVNNQESELSLSKALEAFDTLTSRKGRGNDYLGWLDLPIANNNPEQDAMKKIAAEWKSKAQVVVVIGIGGSYLGSKAALEALVHPFASELELNEGPRIVFAGQNLSQDYMAELMDLLEEKEYAAIVISKSGTTTEPAIAFRIIKNHLETKYGKEEAATRIVAVTDKSRGALKGVASKEGYRTFVIPDDVGGRYSVLTPVGLLPMAVAGVDIDAMTKGAAKMREICMERSGNNIAIQYAALRNLLYGKGKTIEILVNFNPKLQYFAEWWKQLFGESEGKEGKGIFPASVNFTTDLHSMGQYIQEGERVMFETVLDVKNANRQYSVGNDPAADSDGLNFLAGMEVEQVNKKARAGTKLAHIDGGVPNILLELEKLDAFNLGALFYFFEFACGVSAYMLGINPFDQPGVEDYKKNMFALLGKPGYEELEAKLKERL
jgi:glucose-6-phosphate isomerase